MKRCPICNELNDDDYPLTVGAEIKWGGCQECWEDECDKSWWEAVIAMDKIKSMSSQ